MTLWTFYFRIIADKDLHSSNNTKQGQLSDPAANDQPQQPLSVSSTEWLEDAVIMYNKYIAQ